MSIVNLVIDNRTWLTLYLIGSVLCTLVTIQINSASLSQYSPILTAMTLNTAILFKADVIYYRFVWVDNSSSAFNFTFIRILVRHFGFPYFSCLWHPHY